MVQLKLPITFDANVGSNNRVTIPAWLSYVEPGDTVKGYVQIIDKNPRYPFEKNVLSSRHITVGFIKASLRNQEMPSRLRITIEEVIKSKVEVLEDFNLVGYKEDNGSYAMSFSTIKPELETQFHLDTLTSDFIQKYFEDSTTAVDKFVEPFYLADSKKWIRPLFLLLDDEMGARIPTLIYLILSQDYYQKMLINADLVDTLLQRFTNWIFDIADFEKPVLHMLSSHLQFILEKGDEPDYLDTKDLLKLADLQRKIVLMLIKEHVNRGMSTDNIVALIKDSKSNVKKAINELVEKGILRKYSVEDIDITDTFWVV